MFQLTDEMRSLIRRRRRDGYKYAAVLREFEVLGWSDPEDTKPPYRAIIAFSQTEGLGDRGWKKFESQTGLDFTDGDIVIFAADEGDARVAEHVERERDPGLVLTKKSHVLSTHGRLACEVCEFDFAAVYGSRGVGFVECHHKTPLSALPGSRRTTLDDLALLCANCHRMIHRSQPWLEIEELREFVASWSASGTVG